MDEEQAVLKQQIEELRVKLNQLADEKGYTHTETIITSQKLDKLLNKFNEQYGDGSSSKG